jgi:phosphopantothenate synthetase
MSVSRRKIAAWMMLSLLPVIVTGCASVNLNNAERLVQRHAVGFADAVNASVEAEAFVRDSLKTINRLESVIERGD